MMSALEFLLCLLALFRVAKATDTNIIPAPIVVPPSEYWEGNDGPWSTYSLRVGTPAQVVRVDVSTTNPDTWVILSEACVGSQTEISNCNTTRGLTFNQNASSTWKDQGAFGVFIEGNLNYSVAGDFGLETLGLGLSDPQGPTLQGQVVAGLVQNDFYFGNLGLGVQPTNFTNFANPIPSLFSTLHAQNLIPSLTWSYTAGAQYRLKGIFGSLTFGGYDSSRFTPNAISFPFAPDSTRDLVVGLQSIISTDASGRTTELLSSGILAFVDSTVPYIYLPLEACQQFENSFGLEWDNQTQLYLVSDTLHNALTAQNANFTFTLGNSLSGGTTVSIVLPYASFDLTATSPLVNGTSKYFPLKRASNSTQYTLGRTFLQEAYLIADYQRSNFSLSQCAFVDGANEDIVTIHPVGYVAPAPGNSTSGNGTTSGSGAGSSHSSSSLGRGATAGIAVGAAAILITLILLGLAFYFRKWPFHKRREAAELDATAVSQERKADEPDSQTDDVQEKDAGYTGKHELGLNEVARNELEGTPGYNKTGHELYGTPGKIDGGHELHGSPAATEMHGGDAFLEMEGSPVPVDYYAALGASNQPRPISKDPQPRTRGSVTRSPLSPASDTRSAHTFVSPISPAAGHRKSSRASSGTSGNPLSASSEPRSGRYPITPISPAGEPGEGSSTRGRIIGSSLSPAARPTVARSNTSPVSSAGASREVSRSRTPMSEISDPGGNMAHYPYEHAR